MTPGGHETEWRTPARSWARKVSGSVMEFPKAEQHTTVRHTAAEPAPAAGASGSGGGATAEASGATPDARASEAPTAAPDEACGGSLGEGLARLGMQQHFGEQGKRLRKG